MCMYCMTADHVFRHDPPWEPDRQQYPSIPAPLYPLPESWQPWKVERLIEFQDLLRRVKELEDKLGCPCEPNKADYLGLLAERIKKLEEAAKNYGTP